MKLEINVTSGQLKSALPKDGQRASLILPVFSGEGLNSAHGAAAEELTSGLISRYIEHEGFDPKYKQSRIINTAFDVPALDKIILVGLGKRSKLNMAGLRTALAEALVAARDTAGAEHLIFPLIDVDLPGLTVEQFAQVVAEYATLVDYEPKNNKTRQWRDEVEQTHFQSLTLICSSGTTKAAKRGVKFGSQLGKATRMARDLVNEPSTTMTARELGKVAKRIAACSKGLVSVKLFGKRDIQKMKMGGLLAVNKGSVEPPLFIELSYDPPTGPTQEVIGLIGKGVTFDTGGINIKDYSSMRDMKMDMGGAATVLAVMSLVPLLKPKVSLRCVIAATDNQINGKPMVQGDIITSMSGLTVEVGHTDCEGRLTLMDAIHYVQTKCGATKLIDLATLTGDIETALGCYITGVFGNDERFTKRFLRAAKRAGELMHELPMYEEIFRDGNKCQLADLTNDGAGPAHFVAAWFLREFVQEGVEWIHCDIAGSAWRTDATASGIESPGGTGVGVRTLAHFLSELGR